VISRNLFVFWTAESNRLRKECRDLVCLCAQALTLLDYLAKTGSERVAQQCRENAFTIQTLRDFQYVDRDGRDQGVNVREKAKQLVALLRDEERLRQERAQALKTKERMASGVPPAYPSRRSSQPSMNALYGEEFSRSRGSPSSFNSSSSSPRASDLEQTRPQTSGEEELQLQLALAMSREHRLELVLSPEGAARPSGGRRSSSATIDLVDIFGPADPWDAPPTCPVNSDPWESVAVVKSSNPGADSPWTARPSSSSPAHPWGTHQSPPEPWDAPPSNSISNMDDEAWRSPARPVEGEEPIVEQAGPNQVFSPRCESPADADQFGELVAGVQVNGRGNDSPETFDLSRLGPPLDAVTPRQCRTPKAFLGPTAASLVNLDTLIPSNAPVKNKNPFLSGLSTPSPTNPFHCEQPRLTLNQMRPHSTSPLPAHALSYSASLPLPVLQQRPQTLNLPQPLLPLTASTQQTQHPGQSHNPFL
uniref:Epsin 3b n=1 Tax=Sinocyclocheilus rhinocerous TaxID=307959 RepID=A0A673KQA3_9TELE